LTATGGQPRTGRLPPSRLLEICANASLWLPLLSLVVVYGQWFLSWVLLGHAPRPSIDDPTSIEGASWMHPVTFVAILALLPNAATAIFLNAWYVAERRDPSRVLGRLLIVLGLALGPIALLAGDPGRVLYWWLD
jgi:hypothetical protein